MERFLKSFRVDQISDERKQELMAFLKRKIVDGSVRLHHKQRHLINAMASIKQWANGDVDLKTVDPIVIILADTAWDALVTQEKEVLYITDATHNAIGGIATMGDEDAPN